LIVKTYFIIRPLLASLKMMDLGSDIAALEEDIQDFNIEKDFRTSLKVLFLPLVVW